MEKVQGRVTEVIKGARAHHTGEKAESLEKRRHRWDLTDVYKYLMEGCKKDGTRHFTVVFCDMTRGRGCNLKYRRFQWNNRKPFLTFSEGD